MFTSPLFRRLFLPYFLVICCSIAVVGFLSARRLRSLHLSNVENKLRDNSVLISHLLNARNRAAEAQPLVQEVNQLGRELSCRVTIIKPDGTVVADNEADPEHMENHRTRPEVMDAMSRGEGISIRKSGTLHEDLVYYARRTELSGSPLILRLSVHLRELDRELANLYLGLVIAGVVAAVVAGLICFYFARRHALPLVELTQFADSLAHGDLAHRIRPRASGEIATLSSALNSMADSLSKLLSSSAIEQSRLKAILAAMSEGIIATDDQQQILLANAAAGRMLDFDAESAIGRPLWEVLRTEDLLKATSCRLDGGKQRSIQIGPISGRFLEVVLSQFSSPSNAPGMVIAAHDTTETVRYEELRKEFVANVSHELRTPITAIKGFAETLRCGAIQDPQQGPRFLAIIEKHAELLKSLVDDLLDLAQIEAQTDPIHRSPVDLAKLINDVVELHAPTAQQKRQILRGEVPADLPAVFANSDYLERAISNLLDNAIKYTPEGGTISVAARVEKSRTIIEVADNGIGIPPDDLPRIFERFYRVDRSRSRAMGGTGLGLSIVKHVAQAHAGTVIVTSTVGKGSTFALEIPLIPPAQQ